MTKWTPLLLAVFVAACAQKTAPHSSEVEAEMCRQWGNSLATRSRQDTAQTKDEIQKGYASFSLACPSWKHLIP